MSLFVGSPALEDANALSEAEVRRSGDIIVTALANYRRRGSHRGPPPNADEGRGAATPAQGPAGIDAVVGISGGIDSALVAALAVRAFGPGRVLGLSLPHRDSDPSDEADARVVADALGIALSRIDITPIVDALERAMDAQGRPLARSAVGNAKARARMLVLYGHANREGALVLGTGNKTELLVGYFTKYGDGGADFYPIGDLYKTDVWALATALALPRHLIQKAPTAGLWAGQTDEAELGLPYPILDQLLRAFEAGLSVPDAAARAGTTEGEAGRVLGMILQSEHKRTSLVIPKIGFRTPGLDWRLPRTLASPRSES